MIWLTDDDNEDLEMFQDALQRNGYSGETRYVSDGALLMDLLKSSPRKSLPAVIILDLNMHSKTGFEVLTDMKASRALAGIPVIILSGSSNKDDEAKCMVLGCDRYWQKPSSIHDYDAMAKYLITLF
jgi:DNA-binding response OmpR family regulator